MFKITLLKVVCSLLVTSVVFKCLGKHSIKMNFLKIEFTYNISILHMQNNESWTTITLATISKNSKKKQKEKKCT